MLSSLVLPVAFSLLSASPTPAACSANDRTQIALDYAAQYLDVDADASTFSVGGSSGGCELVAPVGFGFCVFSCGGVLALLECDS